MQSEIARTIRALEHQLDLWEERRPDEHFIRDGAVDCGRWFSQRTPRVLWLLKEAYDTDGSLDDLRVMLRDGWHRWTTFGKIACVTQAICDAISGETAFNSRRLAGERRETILNTAVINVRKSGGETSSNVEVLNAYAREDRGLLVEQIQMLDPDVIVLGNTGEQLAIIAEEVVEFGAVPPELEWSKSKLWFRRPEPGDTVGMFGDMLVLNLHHPAKPGVDNCDDYYLAAGMVSSALADSRFSGFKVRLSKRFYLE